jgi:predicted phosphodiesterase
MMSYSKTFLKRLSILGLISILILLLSAKSEAELIRFIVVGDTKGGDHGVNTTILKEIAQATIDEGADFILVAGDLVSGSSDPATLQSMLTTWRTTMQRLYDANIGVYACRGNHDTHSKAAWDNVFTGKYALPGNGPSGEENITFSFTYKNVFIIGLDQYGTHHHRVNQAWLDKQFASNTQPHVFVFGHEPAFSVHHKDCLDNYPSERDTFWKSIAAHGGRVYFSCHDHLYNHARIDDGDGNADNDVHQFVIGTGGASFYTWDGKYDGNNGSWKPKLVYHEKTYGYLLVKVDGLNVTLTWKHRTTPGVYKAGGDQFTYTSTRNLLNVK